ncbi:Protease-associated PA [unidentified eubacterium SCB49]|nr:Protease-associated PA [unidentified eubacterium SCB49]
MKFFKKMKKILLPLFLLVTIVSFGQDYTQTITEYLSKNVKQLDLKAADVSGFKISSQAVSKSMNVTNVYVLQTVNGIEIHNTATPIAIRGNKVMNASVSFVKDVNQKVNTSSPGISPQDAIAVLAQEFDLGAMGAIEQIDNPDRNSYIFSKGDISASVIPVRLVYQNNDNELRLAWDISIDIISGKHYYSARVDAVTGRVLHIEDWVISCSFDSAPHNHQAHGESVLFSKNKNKTSNSTNAILGSGAAYNVFPFPSENPDETEAQLVMSPEHDVASPYGWHDINGVEGPEYTITRGNNVHAYEDLDGNNNTTGESPDGGASLQFDLPYNLPQAPGNFTDAATINLFYWNNILHDVLYQYEFNEENGNFQQNNYGNGGSGGDYVLAQSQDSDGLNNANFATPQDGISGRMQMYVWSAPGEILYELLTINGGPLAGGYLGFDSNFTGTSTALPTDVPITADLALALDDNSGTSTDENDACDPITNAAELNGKIAVIRRGECDFVFKVAAAEAAGAVAVIIVNNVLTDPIPQGGEAVDIGIPSVMIYSEQGELIIAALENGDTINGSLFNDGSGVDDNQRDGSLDAEIISHEYGHGLSIRLTGGPANSGCLVPCTQVENNQCVAGTYTEQMGEGWSDWLGLIMTMETGDTAADPRGIGTYSSGQGSAGAGLRTYPYTTDVTLNPFTYASTNSAAESAPHGVGSVWATMIWDLTWAFIDEYGYDPDTYNGTGGNNIVFQLVLDGLKLQQCNPGFVSGRDGILMADELANGGANRCLIWETFAARGLGVDADQGSRLDRFDQVENFDVPAGPDCTLATTDFGDALDTNFTVFPNPTNGDVNIRTKINVGDVTVSIYDLNGRRVLSKDINLETIATISTNGLQAGIYVVNIEGNNYTHTTKLIKE